MLKINDDRQARVVLLTDQVPWQASPASGVTRKLLERDGAEIARATSIVRYAPGSAFAEHTHELGEEFLVLQGIFSDECGDYGPGTYVRNPPGSRHRPYSAAGCTIFVKLRQSAREDLTRVVVDSRREQWRPSGGAAVLPLHRFGDEEVALWRIAAGAEAELAARRGVEEILVLEGSFTDEQGSYPQRCWIRQPSEGIHHLRSSDGCVLYRKTGHLA